jgi:large subunit ribosomal protein L35
MATDGRLTGSALDAGGVFVDINTPATASHWKPDRESLEMPKLKTHKGMKKRFKVTANGKVLHKRCGSSHLMSHKSGKQVRRLRKKSALKVAAEAHRIRNAVLERQNVNPDDVQAHKLAAKAAESAKADGAGHEAQTGATDHAVDPAGTQP